MKEIVRFSEEGNPIHEELQSYAVACSFSRERAIDPEEFRKLAEDLMTFIARSCFGFGAKEIGHIKAHLKHKTGFLIADTLGTPGDVMVEGRDGDPVTGFTLVINSVVYGLTREAIKTATEQSLESVAAHFGLMREP